MGEARSSLYILLSFFLKQCIIHINKIKHRSTQYNITTSAGGSRSPGRKGSLSGALSGLGVDALLRRQPTAQYSPYPSGFLRLGGPTSSVSFFF